LEFQKTASGEAYTVDLSKDGKFYGWGWNQYGQLGDGTMQNKHLSIDVTANISLNVGEKITKISVGGWHSLAYTTENRLFFWWRDDMDSWGIPALFKRPFQRILPVIWFCYLQKQTVK
jgi:alpha-tubulin suppressor-like RCC1 family protein